MVFNTTFNNISVIPCDSTRHIILILSVLIQAGVIMAVIIAVWILDLQLPMQSVPITTDVVRQLPMQSVPIITDVVSLNLDQGEMYNIM